MIETIYMPLVEEGTEVWRPVHGERQTGETFRVLGPTRQGEAWAFQPGSIVRCALRRFADNTVGLAVVASGLPNAMVEHLTFNEWVKERAARITELGLAAPEEHRADWIRLQIELTLGQALRHETLAFSKTGASGRTSQETAKSCAFKNCHLARRPGLAEFPDCVAARSAKHLRELAAMTLAGDRAVVLFTVQREDCQAFTACRDIDPKFAQALDEASEAGVEVLVYQCAMSIEEIRVDRRIDWVR